MKHFQCPVQDSKSYNGDTMPGVEPLLDISDYERDLNDYADEDASEFRSSLNFSRRNSSELECSSDEEASDDSRLFRSSDNSSPLIGQLIADDLDCQ